MATTPPQPHAEGTFSAAAYLAERILASRATNEQLATDSMLQATMRIELRRGEAEEAGRNKPDAGNRANTARAALSSLQPLITASEPGATLPERRAANIVIAEIDRRIPGMGQDLNNLVKADIQSARLLHTAVTAPPHQRTEAQSRLIEAGQALIAAESVRQPLQNTPRYAEMRSAAYGLVPPSQGIKR